MGNYFNTIKTIKREKTHEPLWLIAYVDLTTNLMALFILMLSMSQIDFQKFDSMVNNVTQTKKSTLQDLKDLIDKEIKARQLDKQVNTELNLSGLQVNFINGVLFDSASANLSDFAKKEAKPLLEILSTTDAKYQMSFEGHTDDVPLKKNSKFSDNWSLSSARGAALLQTMKELGISESRMSVAGFADTRPQVDIKGKTGKELENARSANRRVVIRVFQ